MPLTSHYLKKNCSKKIKQNKQNGGYRKIFYPVHTTKKKVRLLGRGVVKVKTEIEIKNCVFATANAQLSIVNMALPIVEMDFALSEFEFKVFTFSLELLLLEMDF